MSRYEMILGDCLSVMKGMDENSVDAIVTDPPYGLSSGKTKYLGESTSGGGFMGKLWDHGVPGVEFWQEALRVAKPGAHLLAFGGTRTFHRLAVAIEDAGWEMRDTIGFIYGVGFPKSLDVSKNIDKFLGQQGQYGDYKTPDHAIKRKPDNLRHHEAWQRPWRDNPEIEDRNSGQYLSASEEAKKWQGWGTALKPAWEPILVARKPLIGTVAQNVLTHGTGGINVDACRVGTYADMNPNDFDDSKRTAPKFSGKFNGGKEGQYLSRQGAVPNGRWPANLIHDGSDEVVELFPQSQSGTYKGPNARFRKGYKMVFSVNSSNAPDNYGDGGSAARFFYCAKASKADREEGCEHLPVKMAHEMVDREEDSAGLNSPRAGAGRMSGAHNHHPTVKPVNLMRYLCKLVTPPDGLILDMFCGSGSTGKAAMYEGFRFLGIEQEEEYIEIAKARIAFALQQSKNDRQIGLFDQEEENLHHD